ncbi:MAG: transcription antitermination factor NusB [Clostridiaceae bacterium]|nr:transcription antitermination factor NusB [Clostridiaceae bacterium]
MNRRGARELVLHLLFAGDFTGLTGHELLQRMISGERFESLQSEYPLYAELPPDNQKEYVRDTVIGVTEHMPELDAYIEKYAVGWNVARISRVSKCILRLCMYELLYLGIPVGASVNEAVELARAYDSDQAAAFVNGILGSFVAQELKKP